MEEIWMLLSLRRRAVKRKKADCRCPESQLIGGDNPNCNVIVLPDYHLLVVASRYWSRVLTAHSSAPFLGPLTFRQRNQDATSLKIRFLRPRRRRRRRFPYSATQTPSSSARSPT
ncbi:hypothetical protein L1887_05024 [Cichorium endivia]|nr:hypothetical protein L1887_05024 [Cichorium endivia]